MKENKLLFKDLCFGHIAYAKINNSGKQSVQDLESVNGIRKLPIVNLPVWLTTNFGLEPADGYYFLFPDKTILYQDSYNEDDYSKQLKLHKRVKLHYAVNINQIKCPNDSDGNIALEAFEGIGPYEYRWSNGSYGPGISNLGSGNYHCTITDALGNKSITEDFTIQAQLNSNSPKYSIGQDLNSISLFISDYPDPLSITWYQSNGIKVGNGVSVPRGKAKYFNLENSTNGCIWGPYEISDKKEEGIAAWTISPNPTHNELTLSTNQAEVDAELFLCDITGKTLKKQTVTSNQFSFDLTGFPSGTYFLRILSEGKFEIHRIIKQD